MRTNSERVLNGCVVCVCVTDVTLDPIVCTVYMYRFKATTLHTLLARLQCVMNDAEYHMRIGRYSVYICPCQQESCIASPF